MSMLFHSDFSFLSPFFQQTHYYLIINFYSLRQVISVAVKNKKPKHAGMNNIDQMKALNRPMVKIGG